MPRVNYSGMCVKQLCAAGEDRGKNIKSLVNHQGLHSLLLILHFFYIPYQMVDKQSCFKFWGKYGKELGSLNI